MGMFNVKILTRIMKIIFVIIVLDPSTVLASPSTGNERNKLYRTKCRTKNPRSYQQIINNNKKNGISKIISYEEDKKYDK